jgi:Zn-dependent oligopeptidase
LGLEFKKLPNAHTWHEDVTCYEVKDKLSKNLLGHFYLDLYPRADKFNHAAAFPLIKRFENNGEVTPAAAAMVTNFAKAEKRKPSLLAHAEIVTFFH